LIRKEINTAVDTFSKNKITELIINMNWWHNWC